MRKNTLFTFKSIVLFCLLSLYSFYSTAQIQREFIPRFSEDLRGDVTIIANSTVSIDRIAPYNGNGNNNDFPNMVYVDIDNDPTTFNSSNATFNNPNTSLQCSFIRKAYLYWAAADKEQDNGFQNGFGADNQPDWNFNDVRLRLPGEADYTTVTADEIIYRGRDFHFSNDPYVCVKEITDEVVGLADPYGLYQVANVEGDDGTLIEHPGVNGFAGTTGVSGGWQIVFVYESPELTTKNVSIFDGYAHVRNGGPGTNNFEIEFNGFQTPPVGPIETRVVVGALEGDRNLIGDRLQIRNVANNFVDLITGERDGDNFFNSKITVDNLPFIDRTPASLNTLGFDASVSIIDNTGNTIIDNNQTSATVRLTSNQETYGLFLLGLSVDVRSPNLFPIILSSNLNNGNNVNAGDNLNFDFNIFNTGNDNATDVQLTAEIPLQLNFISATATNPNVIITYDDATRTLTVDVPDGLVDIGDPEILVNIQTVVRDECYFLEEVCDLDFDLQITATYNGFENPTGQTTVSTTGDDVCELDAPTPLVINPPDPAIWATPIGDLDRVVACGDATGLAEAQALFPETDKCEFDLIKTSGDFAPNSGCAVTGTFTNTWTFTDACGNTIEDYVQTITLEDVIPPVFDVALPSETTIDCTETPEFTEATATDGCDVDFQLTFNDVRTDGDCPSNFSITRTWTAMDACGNTATASQTINVEDTTPPTIDELPNVITIECPETPVFEQAIASDQCSDVDLTFNDVRTDGDCPSNFSITRTWTAVDACGNTSTASQTINVEDTTPPVFDELPNDTTIECTETPVFTDAIANDSCSDVTLTFNDVRADGDCPSNFSITRTWTATDTCGNTSTASQTINVEDTIPPVFDELPNDTTIECTETPVFADPVVNDLCSDFTLTFNDVLSDECASTFSLTRTWTATDACGNSSTATQTINLEDNTPPVFEELPDETTIECPAPPEFQQAIANDLCSSVTLTFIDVRIDGNCIGNYSVTRNWTAVDLCGNTSTASQTINVEDTTPPTIDELPIETTIECTETPAFEDAIANDLCSDVTLTFNDVRTNGDCPSNFSITRTWLAVDDCGNSTTASQIINVEDTTPPVFDELPAETTIECPEAPVFEDAIANDQCSAVDLTFNDIRDDICMGTYSITRTWTAVDACGNTSNATQIINVVDLIAPVLDGELNPEITVICDVTPDIPNLTFSDNCSDELDIVFNEEEVIIDESNTDLIRTWTVTDQCQNQSTFTQIVHIGIEATTISTNIILCTIDDPLNLNDLINLQDGGIWESDHLDLLENGSTIDPLTTDNGEYTFRYTFTNPNNSLCIENTDIIVNINDDCLAEIPCIRSTADVNISKLVTPNGDLRNQTLEVAFVMNPDLRDIPDICDIKVIISIYNRWGTRVFFSEDYDNSWTGKSRGVAGSNQAEGEQLPTGTYYYVVELTNSGLKPIQGYILLGTEE